MFKRSFVMTAVLPAALLVGTMQLAQAMFGDRPQSNGLDSVADAVGYAMPLLVVAAVLAMRKFNGLSYPVLAAAMIPLIVAMHVLSVPAPELPDSVWVDVVVFAGPSALMLIVFVSVLVKAKQNGDKLRSDKFKA